MRLGVALVGASMRGSPLVLIAMFWACSEAERGPGPSDIASTEALGSPDMALLPDATVLQPGAPDFATADLADAGIEPPPSDAMAAPDEGDVGLPLEVPLGHEDASKPDTGDAPFLDDPGSEDEADVPTPLLCGSNEAPCPPGHACLPEAGTGVPRCRFVAECSNHGAIVVDDILDFLFTGNPVYLKVEASVRVGPAACTFLPCPENSPCCNTCFAPLVIGNKAFWIPLLGQGIAFGCQGSECDYSLTCSPMIPGEWYWIWGTLSLIGGEVQFFVDAFCLVPVGDRPSPKT